MSHPSTPPERIGRYQLVRPLGSGAMGDVFLARDPNIDRDLAIKTVRVAGGTPEDVKERQQRLLREARAAGQMLHPNVVTLFDADQAEGLLYLAFEYVDGIDLAKRAQSQPPLTLRQVLTLLMQVASGLDYAHGRGIVHRDIKPSNILITAQGEAKVADFGIAKIEASSTELTRTGSVVGSPQYMSPEQVRGEDLDGRSDVFSLGVVLYELLCRSRPFMGETLSTLVFEILAKEPIAVDHLRPGLPPRLYTLVSRMMAKDRNERVASAREAMDELAILLGEIPPDELEAPAARGLAEGPTRRMPASDGVPPVPGATPAGASPSGAAPDAPTATQAAAPSAAPGPPPPLPAASAARTPAATALLDGSGETSGASVGRPSPLDTGTYSSSGPGRSMLIVVAALLVLAVVAGIWLGRGGLSDPGGEAPPAQVASNPASPASIEDSATTPQPTENPPEPDPADPSPTMAETPEPRAAAQAHQAPAQSVPPAQSAPPAQTSPPPPRPASPPPPPPPRPAASPPSSPFPSATPSPGTEPAAPLEAEPEAGGDARQARRIAAFDAEARSAVRELETGLRFRFDVEPEDTVVKIQRRGERSIVQGRVTDYQAGDEDARDLELPGDGDYLVTLVHPSYGEISVRVRASAGRGNTAHVVRMDLARARQLVQGGPRRLRAGRGLYFVGQPADAEVWVDGRKRGSASEFDGARRGIRREILQLARGQHTIRLVAPGYEPLEIEVEISPSTDPRVREVPYRLERSGGNRR